MGRRSKWSKVAPRADAVGVPDLQPSTFDLQTFDPRGPIVPISPPTTLNAARDGLYLQAVGQWMRRLARAWGEEERHGASQRDY